MNDAEVMALRYATMKTERDRLHDDVMRLTERLRSMELLIRCVAAFAENKERVR